MQRCEATIERGQPTSVNAGELSEVGVCDLTMAYDSTHANLAKGDVVRPEDVVRKRSESGKNGQGVRGALSVSQQEAY
jgi:hypothetical protein